MGFLNSGNRAVFDSYTCFWNPTPHTRSLCPALIHVEVLSLTAIDMPCLLIFMGDLPFLNRNGGEADWGVDGNRVGGRGGAEGGETGTRM